MGKPSESDVGEMTAEFEGDSLGDARLDERLRRIVSLAAPDPGDSFPEQIGLGRRPGGAVSVPRESEGHDGGRAQWARSTDP